ncbi:hypothetical protein GW17_00022905 [Ensete ventricosum]|nr:hypothetical protein GW17_00022905 [Ensete ventricosum]RZR93479.1 hypothetical protein BHM03_00021993 [Ensete ventricosum]
MAPLLFREIKAAGFSCASPSSAAVCSSVHQRSIVQHVTGRAIDRHTPHLRDPQRTRSQFTSKPRSNNPKAGRKSSAKQADLVNPADSSRCLLSSSRFRLDDAAFYDIFPGPQPIPPPSPFPIETLKSQQCVRSCSERAVRRPSSYTRSQDQVVVLRVSLHCKGCEGKVRRHIAKMQGVSSFSVDLATKKVTVVGDVTPLGVLNSISKVKHAQFWQSPPRASASF